MAVKLWSPKGDMDDGSTFLSLTSGHTCIIPHDKEGVEVPLRFRKEAIARGCIPVGMEEEADEAGGFDRSKVIRDNIKIMLEDDDSANFTTDGKPAIDKLAKLCGFQLARSEVNREWDAMMKEDGDEAVEVLNVTSEPKGKK
ncbi:MAG TPA: hypothetical protein VMZ06_05460 [Candidatus Bathyarchaeia archaeon]|nr:hypothetical protein [Candidatus Bathyarchaeia archaeon]